MFSTKPLLLLLHYFHRFTHDIVQTTIYNLIPTQKRALLHKKIGVALLSHTSNDPILHNLAVDQINNYCKDSLPSSEERALYANINATAAKYAMSSSSFEQARSYIDSGMKLLDDDHWQSQYELSLDLYEKSASVCCMNGDTSTMRSHLDEVITNTKTFQDSLKARG